MDQADRLKLLGTMQRALDQIAEDMPKIKGKPAIDVAARVNGLRLQCEKLLEPAKQKLWEANGGLPGELPGATFRAVLAVVPMPGLDVKTLRVDAKAGNAVALAALQAYDKPGEQHRISFEVI